MMVMPGQHRNAGLRLLVLSPHGLICSNNPWVLVNESNSADVIKMSKKCEQAPVGLIIPHLNLVVISCNYNFAFSIKCTNNLDPSECVLKEESQTRDSCFE